MANYTSSLTAAQIENALLASKAATAINGIVKYNGASGGTASVSQAVGETDYDLPPIFEATNPISTTVGVVKQLYINTSNGMMFACTAASGGVYTWEKVGGADFQVLGIYETLAALQAAVPNPDTGDAYAVGTSSSNVVYIWDGTAWKNIGNIQGKSGVSPSITITDITGGHRITITDEAHPSGQSIDVMNGTVSTVNGVSPTSGNVQMDAGDLNVDDTASTPQTVAAALTETATDITALQSTVSGHTTSITALQSTASGHTTSITALQTADTKIKDMVTDAWSEDTAYAVDDYCISANILYRCIAANTGYQPPNVAYWAVTSASAELKRTRRHLLWENDSPTTVFAAQTVALDLSDYSMVLIACRCSTSVDSEATSLCFMDATTCLAARKAGTNYAREATVASTGVTFTTGYTGSTAGTGNLIPIRIYGLV